MKKLIEIFLLASLGLLSCNNPEKKEQTKAAVDTIVPSKPVEVASQPVETKTIEPDPVVEMDKLNGFLKKHEEKPQVFNVESNKQTQINGKQGTVVYINPDNLETIDRKPLGSNIEIELKELTNQSELLRANAQTVSNGKLLVSGGAYFINMTSGGHQLKIKKGKTLKMEFPKLTDDGMSLFYGQRDSSGRINWQKSTTELVKKEVPSKNTSTRLPGTERSAIYALSRTSGRAMVEQNGFDSTKVKLSEEEKQKLEKEKVTYEKVYAAIDIHSLGWINCDRFLDAPKTEMLVKFDPSDSVYFANVYLIFKSINSMVQSSSVEKEKNSYNEKFRNLPIGYATRLIAYTVRDNKVYAYASNQTIRPNQIITPKLQLTSEADFKRILSIN